MVQSLRARLFVMIVVPLVIVALFAAAARFVMAERTSLRLFDNTLLTVALTISRDVVLSEGDMLAEELTEALSSALGDTIYYRVIGPEGAFVTGYSGVPAPPEETGEGATPFFYDAVYLGQPVRVVAVREHISEPRYGGWVTVLVAQTVEGREALSIQLVLEALSLMAVVILAAGALVWFGINLGLRPLLDLREAIGLRSPDDLSAIRRPVPREVRNLVQAMNGLFERLAQAFSDRDAFIAAAAHQLRNPIAAIQAQAEAAEGASTEPELRRRVAGIADSSRRVSRLTQQLLSMEMARGRTGPMQDTEVDLARLAAETTRGWVPAAVKRGVDLSLETDGKPAVVKGDPIMLTEALENLLDNALRYGCPEGGSVEVRVGRAADRVRLSVSDDGPGIAPEERQQVFERFTRLVEDSSDGCGLGLPIVREIAGRHGGTVRIAETSSGARFEIDLPADSAGTP